MTAPRGAAAERGDGPDGGQPSMPVLREHTPVGGEPSRDGRCIAVSVIVMTWNREAALRRCLDSLETQSFGTQRFEVVLVDVSDVPVRGLVAEYEGRLRIQHIVGDNRGVAGNRNRGAAHASGEWLAFLDDDCIAVTDWLAELVTHTAADGMTLVGGGVVMVDDAGIWACCGQLVTEAVDAHFNRHGQPATFFPGLNFIVSREHYLRIGGTDESFGRLAAEDRDFCDRWRESGGTLRSCPAALVQHEHRTTLRGFLRQQFNYGRGAWHYYARRRQRRGDAIRSGHAGAFHTWSLVREPWRRLPLERRLQVIVPLVVWRCALVAGYVWQGASDSLRRARRWLRSS